MKRGLFISIEGNDGSGKSTQIKRLEAYLKEKGRRVILTREPGGTIISERIREILLDKSHAEMNPITEMLLYAASRAQHVAQLISPNLDKGITVICDRFIDSSLVYQGIARNLGIELVKQVNDIAVRGIMPDLTYFIDIDPETAMNRRKSVSETDRLENEKMEFHFMVYKGYKELKKMFPERIQIIDGKLSIEKVFEQIKAEIDDILDR